MTGIDPHTVQVLTTENFPLVTEDASRCHNRDILGICNYMEYYAFRNICPCLLLAIGQTLSMTDDAHLYNPWEF